MDRRSFLKRSMAALALTAIALNIDECKATQQAAKPIRTVKGLPADRLVFGGNLFNAYARGRDSVYAAEVRVKRTRYFLWKGAY
jgi:hypothetical protein